MKAPKTYTIRKYRLFYVREPDHIATKEKRRINHRNDLIEFAKKYLNNELLEKVVVVAADNKNNVIGFIQFEGTVNQTAVYPMEVFRFILSTNAAAFFLIHNHPGGSQTPSEADWQITERVGKIGKLLELPLLDHIIMPEEGEPVSMKDFQRWGSWEKL